MSENHNLQDDFKLITYKRKTKNRTAQIPHSSRNDALDVDTALRRTNAAKEDILSSDLHTSIVASLREALKTLGNRKIKEIVCLGLGRIGECMISRYQLGLLLCLKDLYDGIAVRVYDPVFSDDEVVVLRRLECEVLKRNLEGKYSVEDSTLFYLPHCPKQLSNNLLWANWGLRLTNCVIIANSFTKIVETHTKKLVSTNADYVFRITPYVSEFAVINTFKYFDIFNDTTIHVFPLDRLSLLPEDFWKDSCEPKYAVEDVEFVTNTCVS